MGYFCLVQPTRRHTKGSFVLMFFLKYHSQGSDYFHIFLFLEWQSSKNQGEACERHVSVDGWQTCLVPEELPRDGSDRINATHGEGLEQTWRWQKGNFFLRPFPGVGICISDRSMKCRDGSFSRRAVLRLFPEKKEAWNENKASRYSEENREMHLMFILHKSACRQSTSRGSRSRSYCRSQSSQSPRFQSRKWRPNPKISSSLESPRSHRGKHACTHTHTHKQIKEIGHKERIKIETLWDDT